MENDEIKNLIYDNIKNELNEKNQIRNEIENRIISNIRSGIRLCENDLNAVYAITSTIFTLENIMNIEK